MEDQLKPIFAQFGEICEIAVIKDRMTGEHRGCAFVTYQDRAAADKAILALHDVKCIPPMTNPLQVRYAEGELEKIEHKLFIGMVPKHVGEDQLRRIFEPFGTVRELVVLREPSGVSRGCAFVKYDTREEALNAINGCNGRVYIAGQSSPLIVKFADTKKNKGGGSQDQFLAQLRAQQMQLQLLAQNPSLLFSPDSAALTQSIAAQYATMPAMGRMGTNMRGMGSVAPQAQGPPGANLFVYHLPQHYTDQDLFALFSPFGSILSTKVFIDKVTGISKCFGFVSYATPDAASLAIQNMNGLQVCDKRLKVELKKRRASPY